MPILVRFLLWHALIGFAVALVFVAALLAFDVARLGTLVWASPSGAIALAALTFALGLTFGSVQMGVAVMLLGEDEDRPTGGSGRRAALAPLVHRLVPAVSGRRPSRG